MTGQKWVGVLIKQDRFPHGENELEEFSMRIGNADPPNPSVRRFVSAQK
jgi:hypothetical protein